MSQDHLELVRRFSQLLNENDWDGIAAIASPDFEWHTASGVAATRIWKGVAATRDWWNSEVAESWDLDRSIDEIDEIYDLGDVVVVAVRSVDIGRRSGVVVESRLGALYEFADGKITRIRVFREPQEALTAAGLGDQLDREA